MREFGFESVVILSAARLRQAGYGGPFDWLRTSRPATSKKSGRGAPHPLPQVAGALRLRFPRLRSGQAGQATGLGVTMGSGEEALCPERRRGKGLLRRLSFRTWLCVSVANCFTAEDAEKNSARESSDKLLLMRKADWSTRPLEDELGEVLRAELLSWPGVQARPMMGALAFFRGKQMLGCYVNRALSKKKPEWLGRPGEPTYAWMRLRPADAERALKRKAVRPSRLGFTGWVEVELSSRAHLEEAVRWFGCAYERPPRSATRKKKKRPSTALRTSRTGGATKAG